MNSRRGCDPLLQRKRVADDYDSSTIAVPSLYLRDPGLILLSSGALLVLTCAGILSTRGILSPGDRLFPKEFVASGPFSLHPKSHVFRRRCVYGGAWIVRGFLIHPSCRSIVCRSAPGYRVCGRAWLRKAIWGELSGLQTIGQSLVTKTPTLRKFVFAKQAERVG